MKKALIGLFSKEMLIEGFEILIKEVEEKEIETYMFYPCIDLKDEPHLIYQYLETYLDIDFDITELYLMTDMWDLLYVYAVGFPHLFQKFVLYTGEGCVCVGLQNSDINAYAELFRNPPETINNTIVAVPTIPVELPESISNSFIQSQRFPFYDIQDKTVCNPILSSGNMYSIFDFSCINRDEALNLSNTTLIYNCDKRLAAILELLRENIQLASKGYDKWSDANVNFYSIYGKLTEHFGDIKKFSKIYAITFIELTAQSYNDLSRIFAFSVLMILEKKAYYFNQIYKYTTQSEALTLPERLFVYWQMARRLFVGSSFGDTESNSLAWGLYRKINTDLNNMIKGLFSFIPKNERNKDFVVVLTGQLLSLNHAPTKTALDRCVALIKAMGKRVLLVNTKELLTVEDAIPFTEISIGNINKGLSGNHNIEFQETVVPYYQSEDSLLDDWKNVIQMVATQKPWCVISIGSTVAADLCSNIVPTITLATTYSSLQINLTHFTIIGRKLSKNDFISLQQLGVNPASYYESLFTFDFKPQTNTYTRKELGLPENKFLIAVIGARLTYEVTTDFMNCLLDTSDYGGHVVLIGQFDTYDEFAANDKRVLSNVTYLGMQSDVLAILDVCNLYANPKRAGGGSSVVESMYKGLPVVTPPTGDVYISAGEEFLVKDYTEMTNTIIRYITEPQFYAEKAAQAKIKAAKLMDTAAEFSRVINEIENSEEFL